MTLIEFLLIFLLSLQIFYILVKIKKGWTEPKNFPKGPSSLIPFFGGMLWAGSEPFKYFLKLRSKWGSIYAFDVGPKRTVIVNHYTDLKKMLPHTAFNGRSATRSFSYFCSDESPHGIVFNSEYKVAAEQRRFTLRNLRDLGFGKRSMESHLEVEIRELLDTFASYKGSPFLIHHHFNGPVVNAVWAILLGYRFEHNDQIVNELNHKATQDFYTVVALTYFPFLFKIHEWFPKLAGFIGIFIENRKFAFKFINDLIQDHKNKFRLGSREDFIERYLEEIDKENDPKSSFYGRTGEKNLATVIHDLFLAGSETTSTGLGWTVHLLALNPFFQEKAFQEIKTVVGTSHNLSLEDRNSLPYTNALILEVLRFASIVPIMPHEMIEDTLYKGMFLPKGTSIFFNVYACLHDPDYWGDPQVFRPERFLMPDGKTLIKHEPFLPFSVGKRQCLGESLAKDSLFLFITAILQRFKIYPDPGNPTPKEIKVIVAATNLPVSFPIIFEDRNISNI